MLFSSGVGLLLFKLRLREDTETPATLSQLIDLNYYLRLVHPPTIPWTLPTLSFSNAAADITVRDLIDFVLQGITGEHSAITDLGRFIDHMTQSTSHRFTDTEFGQVYGERCRILSYACTDIDEGMVEALTPNRISVWRSWRGMAFTERVVFLASEDLPFKWWTRKSE
jgi:hypothetical protein